MGGFRGWSERRTWWAVFGLLAAAMGSWALATPIMTGPDEGAHAIRAAAVARGQWVGGPGIDVLGHRNIFVEVRVPEAYATAGVSECFLAGPMLGVDLPPPTGECPPFEGGERLVRARTYEQRGQPLYYALVGTGSRLFSGDTGVYLMRLLGAVVAAAALASAWVSVARFADRRLAVLGLAAATTPVVLYLGGMVNSGGVEDALAVCAWAAGLALVRGPGEPDRRLVHRTGMALTLLVLTRGFSPLFVLAIVATLLVAAPPGRLRALLARRDVRAWGLALGVAGVASAAWLLMIHVRLPLTHRPGAGLGFAVGRLDWYLQQAVAVFGHNDVVPPALLAVVWGGVALGVVVACLRRTSARRDVAAVAGLFAGTMALQVSADGFSFPHTGFFWQGRYVLPLLTGVVLTACAVAAPSRAGGPVPGLVPGPAPAPDPGPARAWGRVRGSVLGRVPVGMVVLGVLVLGHAWAFGYALRFFAVGPHGPANPVTFLAEPEWSSRWGPAWCFLLLFAAALAGLAALAWRATGAEEVSSGDRDPAVVRLDESPPAVPAPVA